MNRFARTLSFQIAFAAAGLLLWEPCARAACDLQGSLRQLFSPSQPVSLTEFTAKYPIDPENPFAHATSIVQDGRSYQVTGFDPATARVTLESAVYQVLDWEKSGLKTAKVGEVVEREGRKFVVRGRGTPVSRQIYLERTEKLELPLGAFEKQFQKTGSVTLSTDYATRGVKRVGGQAKLKSVSKSSAFYPHAKGNPVSWEQLRPQLQGQLHKGNQIVVYRNPGSAAGTAKEGFAQAIPLDQSGLWSFKAKNYDLLVVKSPGASAQKEAYFKSFEGPWQKRTLQESLSVEVEAERNGRAHTVQLLFGGGSDPSVNRSNITALLDVLQQTPDALWDANQVIRINAAPGIIGSDTAATVSLSRHLSDREIGIMDFYQPVGSATFGLPLTVNAATYLHELGHNVSLKFWNSFDPPDRWVQAMMLDQSWVSDYAHTLPAEDFAETFLHYLQTNAGRKDPMVREEFKHRFDFLDQMMAEAEAASKR